ncbi:NADH dehydrogenase subunit H [Candidatus Nitrososphaera evergladensis SR1]|jgi:NADH-quinone oxidoreductase subunit H|uniref:NADH dehydrogenase subunit H n=1 Tax=Candidatus Nitrososphaera evergladensis SR1 TaxID=1459636 RepID=A0A075MVB5_9ARCH|nr:complex I subunit 1 family protein [Candidatus Nitrososphaera evergladensis]AIF84602.1 NADH dehydrogenase subunit H [Candidatus Nitrososphaera evergladensis SR1]
MAYTESFRFGEFIGSVLWLVFWILIIFSLVGLPLLFVVLFYVPLPPVNGAPLTPYLFLTMTVDPTRTIPIIKYMIHTDLFRVAAFPGFTYAALFAAVTIFVERKFLAKMQLRYGPLYVGKIEGWLQLIADGLKLISKEIIVPSGADKPLFWAAPIAFVSTAAAVTALIPVAPGWVVANVDVGLLAVFAILGFFPLIALLFSWASNSKYPFIGGLRALHQIIAFEIPFIISALSVVILAGTLNLTGIVNAQISSYWYIFFLPISAFVFYLSSLAELERIPFDLPEAESEIVAGWITETSGMIYGLIQLGSYVKTYALAALFVVLFLGGWAGPVIFPQEIIPGYTGDKIYNPVTLSAIVWFTVKTFGVIMLMLLPRGISPRIRIDILLHTGWYKLIVLSFINMFVALALIYGGILGPGGLLVR